MLVEPWLDRKGVEGIGTFKYSEEWIKHLAKLTIIWGLLLAALPMTGCVPMGFKAAREHDTGDKYTENINDMAPLKSDYGRLFVYTLEKDNIGPNNPYGVTEVITVDNEVYRILENSYWFVDIPEGTHKVTADGVLKEFSRTPRYGKNAINFNLKAGEYKYCRINIGGKFGKYDKTVTPIIIDRAIAERELANVVFYKYGIFKEGEKTYVKE